MKKHRLTAILAVATILSYVPAESAIPDSERQALIAFYEATSGEFWSTSTGWRNAAGDDFADPGTECDWYGVVCSSTGENVNAIDLPQNNLLGEIPAEIEGLTDLRRLLLTDNAITGHLPPELGSIPRLWYLHLNRNSLTGEIPAEIGELAELRELWLGDNGFTGSIPAELGNLHRLEVLELFKNALEGEIPPELGALDQLEWLMLEYNQLSGPIPSELSELTNLQGLSAWRNQLSGELPPGIWQLPRLTGLSLSNNQLEGEIPRSIPANSRLRVIGLDDNRLTGPIPPEIGNMSDLISLRMDNNALTGPLPAELGELPDLWELSLESNRISGTIPSELGDLELVWRISLADNLLEGHIPPELGKITPLKVLKLSDNRLTGPIPAELGSARELTMLLLGSNQLNGAIPEEIAQLTSLMILDLHYNALHSSDPAVRDFLASNHWGPWEETQTLSPTSVIGTATGESTVDLAWDAVIFDESAAPGQFTAYVEMLPGGTLVPYADTTSKDDLAMTITGLNPGTPHRLAVQTTTDPHEYNLNTVRSDIVETVQVVTPGVAPAISALGTHVYAIPAVASLAGSLGTMWRTQLVLHNPGAQTATASLAFLARDENNLNTVPTAMTVPPDQSVRIGDVLADVFGLSDIGGGLLVGSDRPLIVTSRTYNDDALGTYGQYIPGEPQNRIGTIHQPAHLIQLSNGDHYRSNLGVLNAGPRELTINVDLFSQDQPLVSQTHTVPPFGSIQLNRIFGDLEISDGAAIVSSETPGAAFFAFASVIDNKSGDPIFISPPVSIRAEPTLIPAIANIAGASNTLWRSDLELANPGDEPTRVRLELLLRNQDNSQPSTVLLNLDPGRSQRLENVMLRLFGASGAGALRITAETGQVVASSRTYTDSPEGTYGQFIPGETVSRAVAGTAPTRLVQLSHSTDRHQGSRTNIGLVNATRHSFSVEIELLSGDGSALGIITTEMEPFDVQQLNNVFTEIGAGDLTNAYAVVRADSPLARFFTYASVVDNQSGDPIYIPAAAEAE